MTALRRLVAGHPLLSFVAIGYALSWWSIPFADGGILPHGPFAAAVIVVALAKGRAGTRELFRNIVSRRGGWVWLLIGPGLVVAYLAVAFVVDLAVGGGVSDTDHLRGLMPTVLLLLLLGGWWEEPGWTGFALPLLQERWSGREFGLLEASLAMGAIRAGWHLPLMISGAIPWYDVVFFSMAFQFLIAWLYNRTGGSVLVPMVFHLTSNVVGGGIVLPLFTGAERDRFYALFIAAAWLLAVTLTAPRRWAMGSPSPTA